MNLLDFAADGGDRAVSGAKGAAAAFFRIHNKVHKLFADAGGAALVQNMGLILIAEIAQGGQNGVGGRLSQTAEGVFLDVLAKLLKTV